jgi:hypothetical protein
LAQWWGQQGDEREQGLGGASRRLVRASALSFHPELDSTRRTTDPDRPAHDGPRQDLHQARLQVGREERFDLDHPYGIAHGEKANLDRRQPRRVRQRGVREDPQGFTLAPVAVHCHGLSGCISAFCPGLQAALALVLQRFWAVLARRVRPRPMIERRACAGGWHHVQERELGMGQTWRERSCAKGAKTSMMASTRGGMRCPPPRA